MITTARSLARARGARTGGRAISRQLRRSGSDDIAGKLTASDLFVLRPNQVVTNVVFPVGGVAIAACGVWRPIAR
jgi:hypothetical protein